MDLFMQAALDEARQGLAEGGIPIGSVLVHAGKIIGRGHNRRVQNGSTNDFSGVDEHAADGDATLGKSLAGLIKCCLHE